jgi:hypothetical protein
MQQHLFLILRGALLALLLMQVSACDRLGLADPVKDAAMKEADARATGSACRHAGRGIEDCYALNAEFARAAVYAGWKEMNDYMRENNIQEVKPEIAQKPASANDTSESAKGEKASNTAADSGEKSPAKKAGH